MDDTSEALLLKVKPYAANNNDENNVNSVIWVVLNEHVQAASVLGFDFPSSSWLKENDQESYDVLSNLIQDDKGETGGIAFYFQHSEPTKDSFDDSKVSNQRSFGAAILRRKKT